MQDGGYLGLFQYKGNRPFVRHNNLTKNVATKGFWVKILMKYNFRR